MNLCFTGKGKALYRDIHIDIQPPPPPPHTHTHTATQTPFHHTRTAHTCTTAPHTTGSHIHPTPHPPHTHTPHTHRMAHAHTGQRGGGEKAHRRSLCTPLQLLVFPQSSVGLRRGLRAVRGVNERLWGPHALTCPSPRWLAHVVLPLKAHRCRTAVNR